MDGFVVRIHTGLLEGFGQGRMSMTGPGQIFRARSVFNGNDSFSNHFASVGTDNVCTKDPICLGIGQHFDKAFRRSVGTSPTVGLEWECSFGIFDSRCLEFFFGLTYRSDFGVRINDTCFEGRNGRDGVS